MATVIPLDVKKLALMSLMEDAEIIPSSFSNIACVASDLTVFGFLPQTDPNVLPLGIKSSGEANLVVSCDCTFENPQGGALITQKKSKSLSLSVSGEAPNWAVSINT